ncbi:MAG: low temperature requirement protein A [Alcanivoracaceae bacterium]|nr:low temperature requirement protein A [Alcanivoracaceae bacterium]
MLSKLLKNRPMGPRDTAETHRAATPLELLFDLVSVIAIAAAAAGLHHAIAEDHLLDGLLKFAGTFFAIWWAWMNYTWFASAYDNDDASFRLLTMVNMAGALTMAAGVQPFFHSLDLILMVAGFVIMRLSMVAQWLRAAFHDPSRRKTALWYASGIALAQVYWVGLMLGKPHLSEPLFYACFGVGVLIELSVPVLSERHGLTPWHRHHIIERYGLLNIIVLGETLLAGSMALGEITADHLDIALVYTALASLVILFSLWWLYFSKEDHLQEQRFELVFTWSYGHLLIYASGAAMGAGFAALIDIITHHSNVSMLVGNYVIAVSVALYMFGLWFVRDRFVLSGHMKHILLLFSAMIVAVPPLLGLEGVALLTFLSVIARSHVTCRLKN